MKRYFLDARELEHPIPLERSIIYLKKLDENSYYYLLHRKEPIPLLALANEHNLNYISYQECENIWHILISPNKDINLEQFIQKVCE